MPASSSFWQRAPKTPPTQQTCSRSSSGLIEQDYSKHLYTIYIIFCCIHICNESHWIGLEQAGTDWTAICANVHRGKATFPTGWTTRMVCLGGWPRGVQGGAAVAIRREHVRQEAAALMSCIETALFLSSCMSKGRFKNDAPLGRMS